MRLLQFFGRLCYIAGIVRTHLLSGSIVGTRRRLRTSPEGVAPATSGVLVQVCIVRCIVLRSYTVSSAVQLLYSRGILCARPVTPQIRNGNAQRRNNARLLIASSSLCAVASSVPQEFRSRQCYFVVLLFRGILCTHPLPTTYRFIWRGSKSSQQRVRCIISRQPRQHQLPTPTPTGARNTSARSTAAVLKHSTAQCTQTFRCQFRCRSDCSVFVLHQSQNVLSCAHRTAPHCTALHYIFSQQHRLQLPTAPTSTSKKSRTPA